MPTAHLTSTAPAASKIRFAVLDGHTFCYIDPRQPLSGGIMASKPQLGATRNWTDGMTALPLDPAWVASSDCPKPLDLTGKHEVKLDPAHVRPATLADFEAFRIGIEPYRNDSEIYEVPAA